MTAFDIQGEKTSQGGGNLSTGAKNFGDSFGGSIIDSRFKQRSIQTIGVTALVLLSVSVLGVAWINRDKRKRR